MWKSSGHTCISQTISLVRTHLITTITVVVDSDLRAKMDEIQQTLGAKKINGMREDDGVTLLKAKTKTYAKKNVTVFPCVDAKANSTEAVPFGGDKVRLKLAPIMIDRDNSLSFFLNGVQIIEKNDSPAAASGFEATDGFDGSGYQATRRAKRKRFRTNKGRYPILRSIPCLNGSSLSIPLLPVDLEFQDMVPTLQDHTRNSKLIVRK